jgi:hypothetical protein
LAPRKAVLSMRRWREALSNPDMARTMSSALGLKQPTPMQLNKMYAYLLIAGLLHPSTQSEGQ